MYKFLALISPSKGYSLKTMFTLTKEQKTQTCAKTHRANRANLITLFKKTIKELKQPTFDFSIRVKAKMPVEDYEVLLAYAEDYLKIVQRERTMPGVDRTFPITGKLTYASGSYTKPYQSLSAAPWYNDQGGFGTLSVIGKIRTSAIMRLGAYGGALYVWALVHLFSKKMFAIESLVEERSGDALIDTYRQNFACRSCMTGRDGDGRIRWSDKNDAPVLLYGENPQTVSIACVTSPAVNARSLVWKSQHGVKYYDRIYTNGDCHTAHLFLASWAIENDVIPARSFSLLKGTGGNNWSTSGSVYAEPYLKEEHPSFALKYPSNSKGPYLDSVRQAPEPLYEYVLHSEGDFVLSFVNEYYKALKAHPDLGWGEISWTNIPKKGLSYRHVCPHCGNVALVSNSPTKESRYAFRRPGAGIKAQNCDTDGKPICLDCQYKDNRSPCARCGVVHPRTTLRSLPGRVSQFCPECFKVEMEESEKKEEERKKEEALREEKLRQAKAEQLKQQEREQKEAQQILKERLQAKHKKLSTEAKTSSTKAKTSSTKAKASATESWRLGGHEPEL